MRCPRTFAHKTCLHLFSLATLYPGAELYGIVHDDATYTIAPEHFTRFKYEQFGFEPSWFGGDRQTVAVIGFLATCWTGMFIGLAPGLAGLIGFLYGKFVLTKTGVDCSGNGQRGYGLRVTEILRDTCDNIFNSASSILRLGISEYKAYSMLKARTVCNFLSENGKRR